MLILVFGNFWKFNKYVVYVFVLCYCRCVYVVFFLIKENILWIVWWGGGWGRKGDMIVIY